VQWFVRPFESPAYVQEVGTRDPRAGVPEVGDTVALYVQGDESHRDIRVRITAINSDDRVEGAIEDANWLGASGDARFKPGAPVAFGLKNVVRIVAKNTTRPALA
jgi:hypothetical protein